jgi:hypothetical protein
LILRTPNFNQKAITKKAIKRMKNIPGVLALGSGLG